MLTSHSASSLNPHHFLQNLRDSQLFAEEELQKILAKTAGANSQDFVQQMETNGVLTKHQVEAVAQRRFSELRIGNYDILDRLGAGGMGTVYKARHRRMKRVVALKVMSRQLCSDEKSVQRFQREVETMAGLSHPNIVLAFDADEAEAGHFLVMEFVNGRDLAGLVQQNGLFSPPATVDIILQSAKGLQYAHGKGIIHRDIKPANLLFDTNGVVKITDLGLARLHSTSGNSGSGSLTQAGGIVGTVDYMPPEQAFDSSTVDHRTDIYSLGCTLHFLMTGLPPYQGSSIMSTLLKHREAPIPSIATARPDCPPVLDSIFRRMVAKTPEQRYQNMSEVVAELETLRLPTTGEKKQVGSAASVDISPTIMTDRPSTQTNVPAPANQTGSDATIQFVLPPTSAKPSVILAEPSRTQAGIIKKYLLNLSLEVLAVAGSAKEVMAAMQARPAELILSAMHLKDMTGSQLARQISQQWPTNTPSFVLISSEEEKKNAESLSSLTNALILPKPFTFEQMRATLSAVLRVQLTAQEPMTDSFVGKLKGDSSIVLSPGTRARLKVLIVDDSAPARLNERNVLQGLGFVHFTEAADGAQAVALTAQQPFDLIVTDFNMPLMDGNALIGYLRQNPTTAKTPIIMVTTETNPTKLAEVHRLGIPICEKGFPSSTVSAMLKQLGV